MNEANNIEIMLDKLAGEIRLGKRPFMGAGRVVNDSACLELIEQIKATLPNELAKANLVLNEQEKILGDAEMRANEILDQAEAEANRMLNQNDIIAQAKSESQRIVAAAQAYAENLQKQYFARIADVMQNTENYLKSAGNGVTNAKYDLFRQMNSNNNAPQPNGQNVNNPDGNDMLP